jgi:regulator of sigma E protease
MTESFLNILAALLGLGLLVFFHELGHYLVARACGIRVEAFSIGFGRAIWSRNVRGVEWRIGIVPFGGYVRLAGMELSEEKILHPAEGTYFARPVWARIATIAAGPLANVLICFLCFCGVFFLGGRTKSWREVSPYIGWIPKTSALFDRKAQPGDKVLSLDGHEFRGLRDLLLASVSQGPLTLSLAQPSWSARNTAPFALQVKRPSTLRPSLLWEPAQFLIISDQAGKNPLVEGSPLLDAGIRLGDRLVWLDGKLLWSPELIQATLNDGKVLLTVQRGSKRLLVRMPRIQASQLDQIDPSWKDWYFSSTVGARNAEFWVLPVKLDASLRVNGFASSYQGQPSGKAALPAYLADEGLLAEDRILAVDGFAVSSGPALVKQLQTRRAHAIVQRRFGPSKAVSFNEAEADFLAGFRPEALEALALKFMDGQRLLAYGDFIMLDPVAVKPLLEFNMSPASADSLEVEAVLQRRRLLQIENDEQRRVALEEFEQRQNLNILGVVAGGWKDRLVQYNPSPWTLVADASQQTWLTLKGLVSGRVGAQNVSSPVGVFVAMKTSWSQSLAEGFYLLGFVSLSLAFFNLLPVPILDGGHIVLALSELVFGKRIPAKIMKWCFLPFMILLLGLMVYTVWNDFRAILGL